MDLKIEEFTPEKQKEVKDFIIECWKEFPGYVYVQKYDFDIDDPQNYYIENGGMFYVLKDEEKVIGTIGAENKGNSIAELRRLYVDKAYRGKGGGSQLVDMGIAFCKEKGFKKIACNTDKIFKQAHALYLKKGFRVTKEDEEDLYMRMDL